MHADVVALELVHVDALDVTSVVLEEVSQLVVQKHGMVEVVGDVELDEALSLLSKIDGAVVCPVDKGKLRRAVRRVRVTRAQTVVVGGQGHKV